MSDAFLDSELTQLRAMAQVIPPIFLFIAAFLVNMILSRLIALEREQIGLLKAVGYANTAIAWHYAKLTLVISLVGVTIGGIAGTRLGHGMASLYGEFYSFPFLVFSQEPDLYVISTLVTFAAALVGATNAISGAVRLAPAVAMRPPAPTRYRSLLGGSSGGFRLLFSQLTVMALQTSGALAIAHGPDDARHGPARGAADHIAVRLRFHRTHDRHHLVQG
jgi:putative ABC transport system permease protein